MLGMQLGRRRDIDRVERARPQHRRQVGDAPQRRSRAAAVSRIAASGSAMAASSNAGLPRIAGTNAQPAAPIPTIPMRILPDMPALAAARLVTLAARE